MIPVCTVVESLAGRDKGHLYVVVGSLAYPYVWIADGRKYNLDNDEKRIAGISGYWERSVSTGSAGPARISNEWIRSVLNRAVKN